MSQRLFKATHSPRHHLLLLPGSWAAEALSHLAEIAGEVERHLPDIFTIQLILPMTEDKHKTLAAQFPNASIWANADQEWIMMGINGPGRKVKEEEIRQLWSNSDSGADLRRIGIEAQRIADAALSLRAA